MATRVTVTGLADLQQKLGRMEYNLQDFSGALEQAGDDYRDQLRKQFLSNGAFGGRAWKALSPHTHKRANKGRILVASGQLMKSYTIKGYKGNVSRVAAKSAVFGSNLTRRRKGGTIGLASVHETGTHRVGHNGYYMPPRRVVKATRALARSLARDIADHIVEPFEGPQ